MSVLQRDGLCSSSVVVSSILLLFAAAEIQEKVHVTRSVRQWGTLMCGGFLVWRNYGGGASSSSFLDQIMEGITTICGNSAALTRTAGDVAGLVLMKVLVDATADLSKVKILGLHGDVMGYIYDKVLSKLAGVRDKVNEEKEKLREDLDKEMKSKARAYGLNCPVLPREGVPPTTVSKVMREAAALENGVWQAGKCSGSVYHGGHEHQALLNEVFGFYSLANPLHADVFPSLIKYESEIVSMTANMVGGRTAVLGGGTKSDARAVRGCTTSGGTESIILAIKAHRDYYCSEFGISKPDMVCCVTAHAAVDKACQMLGIRLKKVPFDKETYRADLSAMTAAIGPNTILLYASAPNFPQGTVDDIKGMGALATKFGVGLHVDCCLGGFVLPFMRQLGYDTPAFDFEVPGVTSMSIDTHKYGFALKGTSVVLYAHEDVRRSQYFCFPDWTGGLYTTPTIAGSRSGGLIAQCWASMVSTGKEGYMKVVDGIVKTKQHILSALESDPVLSKHLRVLGDCEAMIVCFGSDTINVYAVCNCMTAKGWSLNALQHPASAHICITRCHLGHDGDFIADLKDAVAHIATLTEAGNTAEVTGSAAIYGMTGSLPAGPVLALLKEYNDVILSPNI